MSDVMEGWRSIDEAPRDGRLIIIGGHDTWGANKVTVAKWLPEDRIGDRISPAGWWIEGHKNQPANPTIWQPLPELPAYYRTDAPSAS